MKTLSTLTIFHVLVSHKTAVFAQGGALPCYTASDLTTQCAELAGVVVNGRCFFLVADKVKLDFAQAWGRCAGKTGTFAQLQTKKEHDAIINMPGLPDKIYVAIKSQVAENNPWNKDSSFWYENAAGPSSLNGQNTYIGTLAVTGPPPDKAAIHQCIVIKSTGLETDECTHDHALLCQRTVVQSSFQLKTGCVKVGLGPIIAVSDGGKCADLCSNSVSCRGFNLINGGACQMTTWDIDDVAPSSIGQDPTCYHYTQRDP